MGSVDTDPWTDSGIEISKKLARTLLKLREEGDELETREAWLDKLQEQAQCPVCKGDVELIGKGDVPQIRCASESGHLRWP